MSGISVGALSASRPLFQSGAAAKATAPQQNKRGEPPKAQSADDLQADIYLRSIAALVDASGGDGNALLSRASKMRGRLEQISSGDSSSEFAEFSLSADAATVTYQGPEGTVTLQSAELSFHGAVYREFDTEQGHVAVSVEVDIEIAVTAISAQQGQASADPLALDIDGDGKISLSNVLQGSAFDLTGDGIAEQSAFVTGNDVFLAADWNKNGIIDGGQELFGDQRGAANGFAELAKYDSDLNQVIDARDSIFAALVGVRRDGDGAPSFLSLDQLGVSAISLANQDVSLAAEGGNRISQLGSYRDNSGAEHLLADVLLNYSKIA